MFLNRAKPTLIFLLHTLLTRKYRVYNMNILILHIIFIMLNDLKLSHTLTYVMANFNLVVKFKFFIFLFLTSRLMWNAYMETRVDKPICKENFLLWCFFFQFAEVWIVGDYGLEIYVYVDCSAELGIVCDIFSDIEC